MPALAAQQKMLVVKNIWNKCTLFIAYFYLLSCLSFCWNSAFSGKWPILDPCYYQLVILSNSSRVYHWITLWQGKWLQQERIFWTSGWNVCWQGRKNGSGILILWWVIFLSVNTTFVKYETTDGSESKCNFFDGKHVSFNWNIGKTEFVSWKYAFKCVQTLEHIWGWRAQMDIIFWNIMNFTDTDVLNNLCANILISFFLQIDWKYIQF